MNGIVRSDTKYSVQEVKYKLAYLTIGFCALLLVLAPLFLFEYPAIQDYPNHLARIFILSHLRDPIIGAHYRAEWNFYPNLGWDLPMLLLAKFLPLATAGRFAIVLIVAALGGGMFVFQRAVAGRWSAVPLLGAPLLFNIGMMKGFLAFELGVGLALFAAAWWVAIPDEQWRRRLAVASLLSTVLYIVHFAAWATYGVIVLGVQIEKLIAERRSRGERLAWLAALARDALQAAPAMLMLAVAYSTLREPGSVAIGFENFDPPYIRIAKLFWLIDTEIPWLTASLGIAFLLLVGHAIRSGALAMAKPMRTPLLVLLALFFIVPDALGGTRYVSPRLAVAIGLFGIASLVPREPPRAHLSKRLALGALAITAAASMIWLPNRIATEKGTADFALIARQIPEGSRLFWGNSATTRDKLAAKAIGLYHVGSYAAIWRKLLVHSMFAYPGQQPLRFTSLADQTGPQDTIFSDAIKRMCRRGILFRDRILGYDYVVIVGPLERSEKLLLPSSLFSLIAVHGDVRLYRRDSGVAPLPPHPLANGCIRYQTHSAPS